MSSSHALGGNSRPGRILGPSLDKIIKNVAWRKHSNLVAASKSALDLLQSLSEPPSPFDDSPLPSFTLSDADSLVLPLILAVDSASPKIVEPALECFYKLISHGLVHAEIDRLASDSPSPVSRLLDAICRCGGLSDEAVELAIIRTLLSSIRSVSILIRGEPLVHILKSCYNVYLGSLSSTNQICAKASLAQILTIVCARVDADSIDAPIHPVSVGELLELSDKSLGDWNLVQTVQNFIDEVVEGSEGVPIVTNSELPSDDNAGGESVDGESKHGDNRWRE